MREACSLVWSVLVLLFRSRASLEAEILILRHQLNIQRRHLPKRLAFSAIDRLVFVGLYRLACGWDQAPRYLIRDLDGAYGEIFIRRLRSMGIRDRPTSPRSPWQNGYAERLIGSIRRECVDHMIVVGERHLRHVLLCYMKYYNETRTHLSLNKDAPARRAVDRAGHILCRPVLGGLHHQYVRN